MDYTNKLLYQSNYWYNDGLKKAQIHDLSGAIASLRRSLQYNRVNIASRNLLGLVYYGRGEVAEALVEWIISKNLKSSGNIADYYIKKVQENAKELEKVNMAVKKYNQCLQYCEQDGEDLAIIQLKKVLAVHPSFVKGYALLALLYMKTEQYSKARQVLRRAHKIDTTDPFILHYMHEWNRMNRKRSSPKEDDVRGKSEETVTYQLGNETIIQPVAAGLKEHTILSVILYIVIGLVFGAAVMWFLVVPAVSNADSDKTNKEIIKYSDEIAAQKSEISALKKELEDYRVISENAENAQKVAEATQASYEILLQVASEYSSGRVSLADMAEKLMTVNADSIGEKGKEELQELKDQIYPTICKREYRTGRNSFNVANYDGAIKALTEVVKLDETYEDGNALFMLAESYNKKNDSENAKTYYTKVVEQFPDTEIAQEAQTALHALGVTE